MIWREVGKTRLPGLMSRRMSYPSMTILIANSIFNVALSRFPHRQVSVVAKKNTIFGAKIARKKTTLASSDLQILVSREGSIRIKK